jgi:hypothetical protein
MVVERRAKKTTKRKNKSMRFPILATALIALTACTPEVPDSAAGVGFDDYDDYLAQKRERDRALATGTTYTNIAGPQTGQTAGQTAGQTGAQAAQTDAQATANAAVTAIGGTPAQQTGPDASAVLVGQSGTGALPENDGSISDEQDFGAVSGRQTIQSDAERRRNQSAQYQVVQPEDVPNRPKGTAPTPIEFAVETTHTVGTKKYRRSGFAGTSKYERNCASYPSNELAQDAFLQAGGPDKDKLGIDPDGDGFACSFNPTPYRGSRAAGIRCNTAPWCATEQRPPRSGADAPVAKFRA